MDLRNNLPGFLMTSEVGSFAEDTILNRKPKIIKDVIFDNNYPPTIVKNLNRFSDEILTRKVKSLIENAPDTEYWNTKWQKFKNNTWLELPWYFAESYFYRRLSEITQYFQPGPLKNLDPFQLAKIKQLRESLAPLSLAMEVMSMISDSHLYFENLLHASLWGNRIDLSNLTVPDEVRQRQAMIEKENLLINDFNNALRVFEERSLNHIAFINDNIGMELGFDLFLSAFLLQNGWVEKITFYLKPYPFFVSDAMTKDLKETLKTFTRASSQSLKALGKQLPKAFLNKKLHSSADWFWASSDHFNEMPKSLYKEISNLDLVILKGDVNYRRLLSGQHWPFTMPIEKIINYFPTSLLVLRTLKGEIMVGLKEGQADRIHVKDPEWMINGKRGIIQYIEHPKKDY